MAPNKHHHLRHHRTRHGRDEALESFRGRDIMTASNRTFSGLPERRGQDVPKEDASTAPCSERRPHLPDRKPSTRPPLLRTTKNARFSGLRASK